MYAYPLFLFFNQLLVLRRNLPLKNTSADKVFGTSGLYIAQISLIHVARLLLASVDLLSHCKRQYQVQRCCRETDITPPKFP